MKGAEGFVSEDILLLVNLGSIPKFTAMSLRMYQVVRRKWGKVRLFNMSSRKRVRYAANSTLGVFLLLVVSVCRRLNGKHLLNVYLGRPHIWELR
jgi:hypothetical protein